MAYSFDEIIDRRHTDSIKYDFAAQMGKPDGILPLWVADMDFRTPPCVVEALVERSRHGVFGYSESGSDYFEILRDWFARYFDWEILPEWLIKTPGVVCAIHQIVRAVTEKGDAVLIQQPVYHPFSEAVLRNRRRLVVNRLLYDQEKYTIDFADFEEKIVSQGVKLFILCSPHNPVSRVWTREELTRMGDICCRHGVTVISDEIHADFTYPGHRHLVFAGLKPAFADISIVCTAPTKTFNLAGLSISNIFIPNGEIRRKVKQEIAASGLGLISIMGLIACKAAYKGGHEWLAALREYLSGNLAFLRDYLTEKIPSVQLVEPDGTYLVWLDFRGLGLSDQALDELIVHKARLWLDAGTMFGAGGEGFQRINIACPRAVLEQALVQLEQAIQSV